MEPVINPNLSPESPDFEPLNSVFYDETETGWDETTKYAPTEAEGEE